MWNLTAIRSSIFLVSSKAARNFFAYLEEVTRRAPTTLVYVPFVRHIAVNVFPYNNWTPFMAFH